MGTADPKLDGRLDGTYTFATLPAATSVPAGTRAYTSDRGVVVSDGAAWQSAFNAIHANTPLTGFTLTINDNATHLLLTPAGTIAAGTVNLPTNPFDGQEVVIMSSQTITALTLSGNGKTLSGAITTIGATSPARYKYVAANTTWYRAA